MSDLKAIDQYIRQNQPKSLDLLKDLLRIPSISADKKYLPSVEQAARTVFTSLTEAGLEGHLIESEIANSDGTKSPRPPLVYAESPPVPGKPVVLVYGHYDVQPPEPLAEWTSPPFEPTVRDGNLYARGSTDDKGQMLTHVNSVAAWAATNQRLPLQVKFLIEGEEEVGSEHLADYLATPDAAEKLACDVIVISDSSQYSKGQPAITYGLRGIAYFEIHVTGPKVDLHSGSFGGSVANPANSLARLISKIVDENGRIQLPGFYDSVKPLSDLERKRWQELNFSDSDYAAELGVRSLVGEQGFTTLERRWARPTCDVNGLWSGYQGEGGKTIIPASAGAKVSFRLVPDQDPKTVAKQLQQFIDENAPPGVEVRLVDLHGGNGVVVDPESPFIAAAQKAITAGFDKPAVLIREGGSIPIVAEFVKLLKADVLLLGWGQNDDGAHSPNEKFCVDDYYRGILASSYLWHYLAE